MRKILLPLIIILLILVNVKNIDAQGLTCSSPRLICIGSTYPAVLSGIIDTSADYNCLSSYSFPSWFYTKASQSGNIVLNFTSTNSTDIDFICWGPFDSLTNVCSNLLAGSVIDCSYSNAYSETCTIQNGVVGKYYMICITNYAGTPTNIVINQTSGTGSTICISNNGPLCSGNTLSFNASSISGATYSWTGPNGFTSTLQNPVINNVTLTDSGVYSMTYTLGTYTSTPLTTNVVVYPLPVPSIVSNSPVCQGKGLMLSSGGGNSYYWSGPNGFSSTLQSPSISNVTTNLSGNYYVFVTDSNSCSASDSTNVIINPLPTLSIASNSPKCPGDTLKLSATGNGILFHWTGPNGFTSTSQSVILPNATTNMSGTYTVLVTNSNGCTSHASSIYTVSSSINATSNSPVCERDTLKFFASGIWNNYHWSGPNGFSSNLQNPFLIASSITMSGLYSVTVTNNSGCSAKDTTPIVLVHSRPNVNYNGTVPNQCENGPLFQLTGGFPPGGVYYGTAISGNYFNPNQAGMEDSPFLITYIFTDSNGCRDTAFTTITVSAPPVVNVSHNTPCSGKTLNLYSSCSTGINYSWTGPAGFSSTNQNPVLNFADSTSIGNYMVVVADNLGCTDTINTNVIVHPLPNVIFPGTLTHQCINSVTYQLTGGGPAGGSYSGTGVTGTNFNASSVGITGSPFTITYTYSDNFGCTDSAINYIRVDTLPTVSISSNSPVCYGDSLLLICTTNASEFLWTGPNGFNSTLRNPVDTFYLSGGNYDVTVTDTNGCKSFGTISASMLPLGTIHGLLKLNDQILYFPSNTNIELYKEENSIFKFYDSTITWNGLSFIFYNIIPGKYILKANLNIPFYPDIVPSYYSNTNFWFYADTIVTTCNSNLWLTVSMKEISPPASGKGKISGNVYYALTNDSVFHPVQGVLLYLDDINNQTVTNNEHTLSDTAGHYEFTNIETSPVLKKVLIDFTGLPIVSNYNIYFSSSDSLFNHIDFFIDTTTWGWGIYKSITTNTGFIKFNDFSTEIYPNPVKDIVYINYYLNKLSHVNIEIFDISGNKIKNIVNSIQNSGNYSFKYFIRDKMSGTYLIKFTVNNTIYVKKIILAN